MKPKSTSYEVQIFRDKHWVLDSIVEEEGEAIEFADNLISRHNYAAVRVVRDFKRLDGLHSETVLHERTKAPQKTEIAMAPVGDAPICTDPNDAFSLASRLTIGRLFRPYLDEVLLTPTELLHTAREMKRLTDKGALLMNAVDQISRLQAPQGGEEGKARRDFLHRAWDQLQERARKAAPDKPAKGLTLAEIMARAGKSAYQARLLMSTQLVERRGWMAKLNRVLSWAGEEGAAAPMALLDGLIADLLIPAETAQELLGFQINLATALGHMCDLAGGRGQEAKGAPEAFGTLNRMLGAGILPEAREALFHRVSRELRSTNALSRNEPAQEFEAFLRLTVKLIDFEGVTGGPEIAEALTLRFVRLQSIGGQAGVQNAIDELTAELGGRARGAVYLMTLAASHRTGGTFKDHILRKLGSWVEDRGAIDDWVPAKMSPPDRMGAMTRCNRTLQADTTLPEKLRTGLAAATDGVLVDYLEQSGVIEKIDKPEDPLAFRALRLVKFCASGVLIKGRALEMAHKRVLGHLRQPNFEEKFLSSIPDKAQAEKHLREFHKLLIESGFKF